MAKKINKETNEVSNNKTKLEVTNCDLKQWTGTFEVTNCDLKGERWYSLFTLCLYSQRCSNAQQRITHGLCLGCVGAFDKDDSPPDFPNGLFQRKTDNLSLNLHLFPLA